MAKFKLYIKSPAGNTILTDFDTSTNNTSYTFDESLMQEANSSTLNFSMFKYNINNGIKELNYFCSAIKYGTIIVLENESGNIISFNVDSISYKIYQDNVEVDYTCIDTFKYNLSKLNIGYEITSDTENENFIGAITFDEWAKKIHDECSISWEYIPINTINKDILLKEGNNSIGFNSSFSFSCSNSNAYAALVALAQQEDFILKVDYSSNTFGFIPSKNPVFNGYYVNPQTNLQQLDISSNGENLVTIMNVSGRKNQDDQDFTLIPQIPDKLYTSINDSNGYWNDTTKKFDSSYYKNLGLSEDDATESLFIKMGSLIPWLENKIINIDYFRNNHIISNDQYTKIKNILENTLRITNGHLILETRNYLKNYESSLTYFNKIQCTIDSVCAQYHSFIDAFILANADSKTCDYSQEQNSLIKSINEYIKEIKNNIAILHNIVEVDNFINEKQNNQFNMQKVLYKNIYEFEHFFNSFVGSTTTTVGQRVYSLTTSTVDADIRERAQYVLQLNQYWDSAYLAAIQLGLYLPSNWDCCQLIITNKTAATENYFNFLPLKVDSSDFISLNETLIPTIIKSNEKIDCLQWKCMNTYNGNRVKPTNYNLVTSAPAIDNIFMKKPNGSYFNYVYTYIVDGQNENSYTITAGKFNTLDEITSMMVPNVFPSITEYPIYNLWSQIFTSIQDTTLEYSLTNYYYYKKQHLDIWKNLYADYPGIFLETNYNNTTALTELQLYTEAKAQFDILSNPTPNYNLGLINDFVLNGQYYTNIKISDQLRINYIENTSLQDELNQLLLKPLYISSINYNLRDSSNIKVSVIFAKATDLMFKRFAKILNFAH
jgi:hypothetical protein